MSRRRTLGVCTRTIFPVGGWVGGWMGRWLGGWVGGSHFVADFQLSEKKPSVSAFYRIASPFTF
jgi:hypothetical protein